MWDKSFQEKQQKQVISSALKLTIIGFFIIWGASIALALQLRTLFTPGRFPIGVDPSFDILVAVFCFIILVLGALILWRGIREIQGMPEGKYGKYITMATMINLGLLFFVFAIGGLVFSANRAFAAQNTPLVRDETVPDYSYQEFPTPAVQPTPSFDPQAVFLAGNIISNIDGFRVGTIWVSASKAGDKINYIQVFTNRITCTVQDGSTMTNFAINQSQQLIGGPIQVQDGDFYAAQNMAVIHGVMVTTAQAYGTVYLHYIDPATNRSCDLGSFSWTATPSK